MTSTSYFMHVHTRVWKTRQDCRDGYLWVHVFYGWFLVKGNEFAYYLQGIRIFGRPATAKITNDEQVKIANTMNRQNYFWTFWLFPVLKTSKFIFILGLYFPGCVFDEVYIENWCYTYACQDWINFMLWN